MHLRTAISKSVLCAQSLERVVDVKHSHQEKKKKSKTLTVWDGYVNCLTGTLIPLCIFMSKHRITYLKYMQWLFKNKTVVCEADVLVVS